MIIIGRDRYEKPNKNILKPKSGVVKQTKCKYSPIDSKYDKKVIVLANEYFLHNKDLLLFRKNFLKYVDLFDKILSFNSHNELNLESLIKNSSLTKPIAKEVFNFVQYFDENERLFYIYNSLQANKKKKLFHKLSFLINKSKYNTYTGIAKEMDSNISYISNLINSSTVLKENFEKNKKIKHYDLLLNLINENKYSTYTALGNKLNLSTQRISQIMNNSIDLKLAYRKSKKIQIKNSKIR